MTRIRLVAMVALAWAAAFAAPACVFAQNNERERGDDRETVSLDFSPLWASEPDSWTNRFDPWGAESGGWDLGDTSLHQELPGSAEEAADAMGGEIVGVTDHGIVRVAGTKARIARWRKAHAWLMNWRYRTFKVDVTLVWDSEGAAVPFPLPFLPDAALMKRLRRSPKIRRLELSTQSVWGRQGNARRIRRRGYRRDADVDVAACFTPPGIVLGVRWSGVTLRTCVFPSFEKRARVDLELAWRKPAGPDRTALANPHNWFLDLPGDRVAEINASLLLEPGRTAALELKASSRAGPMPRAALVTLSQLSDHPGPIPRDLANCAGFLTKALGPVIGPRDYGRYSCLEPSDQAQRWMPFYAEEDWDIPLALFDLSEKTPEKWLQRVRTIINKGIQKNGAMIFTRLTICRATTLKRLSDEERKRRTFPAGRLASVLNAADRAGEVLASVSLPGLAGQRATAALLIDSVFIQDSEVELATKSEFDPVPISVLDGLVVSVSDGVLDSGATSEYHVDYRGKPAIHTVRQRVPPHLSMVEQTRLERRLRARATNGATFHPLGRFGEDGDIVLFVERLAVGESEREREDE